MALSHQVSPGRDLKPLTILLADDMRDLQVLITVWLEEAGHTVTCVSNGCQIVQLVQQQRFDLLITDILMAEGDGWEAIAAVRRLHPETRILAISGGAMGMPAGAVLRVAHRAGACGFLAKPFSRLDFLSAVSRVMAVRKLESPAYGKMEPVAVNRAG
jgi:CheY-like chemotaxis protein